MGLMEAAGAGELLARVFGMDERRSELGGAGIRFLGDARVADEGEDGVVEGRGGDFDLAALRGGGVFRQDTAHELELFFAEVDLVLFGKVGALSGERVDDGIAGEIFLVHPGELGEELEVAPIAEAHADGGLVSGRGDVVKNFHETRPAGHHAFLVDLEGAEEDFRFLLGREGGGGGHGGFEPDLAEFSGSVLFELEAEGGNDIEGGVDGGKLFEELDHAVVILEGVEARPGEDEAASGGVAVLGLVHVPENDEVDGSHGEVASGEWPVASEEQNKEKDREKNRATATCRMGRAPIAREGAGKPGLGNGEDRLKTCAGACVLE